MAGSPLFVTDEDGVSYVGGMHWGRLPQENTKTGGVLFTNKALDQKLGASSNCRFSPQHVGEHCHFIKQMPIQPENHQKSKSKSENRLRGHRPQALKSENSVSPYLSKPHFLLRSRVAACGLKVRNRGLT